jgi:lipopolysaccharide heptosyltransferase II
MSKRRGKPILIVLIAGIGDLVLGSASFRALRNGNPDADLHLLTSSDAAPIAQNYGYLDQVWIFPIRELRKNKLRIFNMIKTIHQLRKVDFGIVVNLYRVISWTGAAKMGLLFSLLRTPTKIGHNRKGFGRLMDEKAPAETFQDRHFVDAMMDIAQLAGGLPDDEGIEVFWDESSEMKWQHLFSQQSSPKKRIIAINPGANTPNKRWEPENYVLVANRLMELFDVEIMLLGGPGEENIAQAIQGRITKDVTNLSGQLALNDLVYIISQSDLLITNDSGPMHIAAALKTPLVAIFGPENPIYTRPYTTEDLYRIAFKGVDCRPCQKKNCGNPVCLDLITPEEVLEKCVEMLER